MNVLIVYGTNSGGTYFAGEKIGQFFEEKGHEVKLVEANTLNIGDIHHFDLIILGTNTWNYDNKEGQPHIFYLNLADAFRKENFTGKKFVVYGLGDSSYAKFCESTDYLESLINSIHGNILLPALKIDGYYRDEVKSNRLIEKWLNNLLKSAVK